MKRIKLLSLLLVAIAITGTGCLKDKGFDNHEYGINDPDGSPAGVGFNLGVTFRHNVGLDLAGIPDTINGIVNIALFASTLAQNDINVKIASDTMIVADYNREENTSIIPLDEALFSFDGTDRVIKQGEKMDSVNVIVPSTLTLDPNKTYGIGVKIVSADPGFTIATNENKLLLVLGIKNKYDGVYELHGQFYHPTAAPGFPLYTIEVEMQTTGPNSVKMFSPDFDGFYHPWSTGTAITAFASQEPEYTVDPITEKVTVFNSYVPAVSIYSMGIGFDNLGYDSRWENLPKIMYANFGYNLGPGGAFNPAASREWIDTLIWLRPRN
jgi:hypothetical protein